MPIDEAVRATRQHRLQPVAGRYLFGLFIFVIAMQWRWHD